MASVLSSRPDPRTRWTELLARWSRSGLRVGEFCRRHAVPRQSFYRWKRALARAVTPAPQDTSSRPPAHPPSTHSSSTGMPPSVPTPPSQFVPVRLVQRPTLPFTTAPTAIEFALRDGRLIRLSTDLSAEGLARFVAALEEATC